MGIALLVDRGLISYNDPISKYWPEFAAHSKGHMTVRQLMSHRGALAAFSRQLTNEEFSDKKILAKFIADQPLNWELKDEISNPSIAFGAQDQGYHAITRGLIASELCYRVDPQHRYLGEFLKQELCDPLGIEFYVGLAEHLGPRVAPPSPQNIPRIVPLLTGEKESDEDPQYNLTDYEKKFFIDVMSDPNSLSSRAVNTVEFKDMLGASSEQSENQRKMREVEMPSSNGYTNSRSMAVLASLCAENGTWEGKSIFKNPSTLQELIRTFDAYNPDKVLGTVIQFTQGGIARFQYPKHNIIGYGWGGAGGSMIRYVPELSIGVGYTMNKLGVRLAMNDPRPHHLLDVTLECAKKKLSRM